MGLNVSIISLAVFLEFFCGFGVGLFNNVMQPIQFYTTAIFDRSGRYVITGSDDRLVKVWSMETAYSLASCRGHEVSLFLYFKTCFLLFV